MSDIYKKIKNNEYFMPKNVINEWDNYVINFLKDELFYGTARECLYYFSFILFRKNYNGVVDLKSVKQQIEYHSYYEFYESIKDKQCNIKISFHSHKSMSTKKTGLPIPLITYGETGGQNFWFGVPLIPETLIKKLHSDNKLQDIKTNALKSKEKTVKKINSGIIKNVYKSVIHNDSLSSEFFEYLENIEGYIFEVDGEEFSDEDRQLYLLKRFNECLIKVSKSRNIPEKDIFEILAKKYEFDDEYDENFPIVIKKFE
jgi:hypothetical protein